MNAIRSVQVTSKQNNYIGMDLFNGWMRKDYKKKMKGNFKGGDEEYIKINFDAQNSKYDEK